MNGTDLSAILFPISSNVTKMAAAVSPVCSQRYLMTRQSQNRAAFRLLPYLHRKRELEQSTISNLRAQRGFVQEIVCEIVRTRLRKQSYSLCVTSVCPPERIILDIFGLK
jgi:hypothetical protein